MDSTGTVKTALRGPRKWIVSTALLAGGIVAGFTLASGPMAQAAAPSGTTTANTAAQDPMMMNHGPGETLLEGSTATKVQASAEAAVDGTVLRVETDSSGATYEAHIQKADGSVVTVTFDKDMQVTGTIDGFGQGSQA